MDKAGENPTGKNPSDGGSSKGRSSSKKKLPDLAKLGKARPTKIPRNVKEAAEVVVLTKKKVHWKLFFGLAGACIFLCFAAYGITVWNGLALADSGQFQALQQGLQSQDFWLDHWSDAVARPLSEGWTRATFAWDLTSFNWNPGWSHLVNICLHAFTCLYIYLLTFRLSWRFTNEGRWQLNPYFVAAAAAGLFAVHPLASGAVAYISGRSALLVSLNYFLVLNCFLLGYLSEGLPIAISCYLACFIFIAIALFCGPQAVTLPIAMFALGLLVKPTDEPWKIWMRQRGIEMALFLIMAVAMPFALLLSGLPGHDARNAVGIPSLSPVSYWATQFKSLISYYLRCAFVPFGLSVAPPYTVAHDFSDPLAIVGGLVVAASAALLFVRQNALSVLGLLIFVLGLFPNLVVVHPDYISDDRFYLSLAGLCIIAASYLGKYFQSNQKQATTVCAALIVVLGASTVWRCHEWKDDLTLWQQAIAVNPNSVEAHLSYAQALSAHKRYDQAKNEAKKALQLSPSDRFATLVLARALVGAKNYAEAIDPLQRIMATTDQSPKSQQEIAELKKDLAYCYMHMNRSADALRLAQEAQRIHPNDPTLHLIVGKSFLDKKGYMVAFMQLQAGLEDDPSNKEFLVPVAEAAFGSGQPQWLRYGLGAAARAYFDDKSRNNTLLYARGLVELGVPKEALKALEPLLKSEKPDAEADYIASVAQENAGNAKEAATLKATALKLDPNVGNKVPIKNRKGAKSANTPGASFRPTIAPTGIKQTNPPANSAKPTKAPSVEVKPTNAPAAGTTQVNAPADGAKPATKGTTAPAH